MGYSSPAYTAAASWRIREDWFLQQALRDERNDEYDNDLPSGGHAPRAVAAMPRDEDDEEDGPSGNR